MFCRFDRRSGVLGPPSLACRGWPALAGGGWPVRGGLRRASIVGVAAQPLLSPNHKNQAWPQDRVGGKPVPTWVPRADRLLRFVPGRHSRGGEERSLREIAQLAVATCEALPAREPVRACACSGAGHGGPSARHLPGLQTLRGSTFPWHLRSPGRLRPERQAPV